MTFINFSGKRGVRHSPSPRYSKQLLRTGLNERYFRNKPSHRAKILKPEDYPKTDAVMKEEKERRTSRVLQEYSLLFKEIDTLLDYVIDGKEDTVKKREVSRCPQRDRCEGGITILVPKETVLAKLRVAKEDFTIELETRKARTAIRNINKACFGEITNKEGALIGENGVQIAPVDMKLMIAILRETKEFLDHIYTAEEFTRIDELLEKYDRLVGTLIKVDDALARIEKRSRKSAMRLLAINDPPVSRKEFMAHFKENMLGSIELDKEGEREYHTPETSEYLGKRDVVKRAIAEIEDLILSLQVSAMTLTDAIINEEEEGTAPENLIKVDFRNGAKK